MMAYNAANRKDVRRAEKVAQIAEGARLATTRMLMGTTGGRQWFYDLLTECHVFASSFSLNSAEAAFKEGERNVGLRLLNDVMQASPDEYVQMMREANVRHSTADSIAERAHSEDGDGGDQGLDAAYADSPDGGDWDAGGASQKE